MSWRKTLLTGILAAGLVQAYVPGGLVSAARADDDRGREHHHWDRGVRADGRNWDHDRDDRGREHHHWDHGVRAHGRDWDRDHDHGRWWREHREHDYDHWWESRRDGDHRVKGDNTRDCWAIRDRIEYDRAQVRKIEPTGRHRKALQWYKDDIENARNDMRTCRR